MASHVVPLTVRAPFLLLIFFGRGSQAETLHGLKGLRSLRGGAYLDGYRFALRRAAREISSLAEFDESLSYEDQEANPRIPRQIVLTGHGDDWRSLESGVKANVNNTLALNPDLKVRWFSDAACRKYLHEHFDEELVQIFHNEARGSYRGDICRAAVLFQEGGFYVDVDVQMAVPFSDLVDVNTSFMSVWTEDHAVLNALFASEPKSSVLKRTLQEIRRWYRGESEHSDEAGLTGTTWMGPLTMLRAVRGIVQTACPVESFLDAESRHIWQCGGDSFRMFQERKLDCLPNGPAVPGCSPRRASSSFVGLHYAFFEQGSATRFVGWPRYDGCSEWGCEAGGWSTSAS